MSRLTRKKHFVKFFPFLLSILLFACSGAAPLQMTAVNLFNRYYFHSNDVYFPVAADSGERVLLRTMLVHEYCWEDGQVRPGGWQRLDHLTAVDGEFYGCSDQIYHCDPETGAVTPISRFAKPLIITMLWGYDGKLYYICDPEDSYAKGSILGCIDLTTGEEQRLDWLEQFPNPEQPVYLLAVAEHELILKFLKDGQYGIYALDYQAGTFRLLDVRPLSIRATVCGFCGTSAAFIDPDTDEVLLLDLLSGKKKSFSFLCPQNVISCNLG